jgi:hypothetical protein
MIVALTRAIRHLIVALAPRVEAIFLLIVVLALTPVLITVLGLTLLLGLLTRLLLLGTATDRTRQGTACEFPTSPSYARSPVRPGRCPHVS